VSWSTTNTPRVSSWHMSSMATDRVAHPTQPIAKPTINKKPVLITHCIHSTIQDRPKPHTAAAHSDILRVSIPHHPVNSNQCYPSTVKPVAAQPLSSQTSGQLIDRSTLQITPIRNWLGPSNTVALHNAIKATARSIEHACNELNRMISAGQHLLSFFHTKTWTSNVQNILYSAWKNGVWLLLRSVTSTFGQCHIHSRFAFHSILAPPSLQLRSLLYKLQWRTSNPQFTPLTALQVSMMISSLAAPSLTLKRLNHSLPFSIDPIWSNWSLGSVPDRCAPHKYAAYAINWVEYSCTGGDGAERA